MVNAHYLINIYIYIYIYIYICMYVYNIISESKNENTVSVSHGGQQENNQLITVIHFIEQAMKTCQTTENN